MAEQYQSLSVDEIDLSDNEIQTAGASAEKSPS